MSLRGRGNLVQVVENNSCTAELFGFCRRVSVWEMSVFVCKLAGLTRLPEVVKRYEPEGVVSNRYS